jgi:hypothetical protein
VAIRFSEIAPSATSALAPYLERRLCLLPSEPPGDRQGIGTGAFISASGRRFIITCAHVAQPFLADSKTELVVGTGIRVPRRCVTAVHIDPDPEVDIALLELHDRDASVECFEVNDFANIADFSGHSFQGSDFLVCGMPFASRTVFGRENRVTPLLYLSEPCSSPPATRDHLYAVYPRTPDIARQTGVGDVLPHPGGLSGSILFVLPSLLHEPLSVWAPNQMRAAGIVVRASETRHYLEAINIERLREAVFPLFATEA